jgi:rare lipoprotein A
MKYFLCVAFLFLGVTLNAQTYSGTASFYASKFNGRKTATGEVFSNNGYTCACNKIKLGTMVKVTNKRNGKSVIVKVNDRLAANNHRIVDLTQRCAKELGYYSAGLTQVEVEVVSKKKAKETEIDQPLPAIDSTVSQEGVTDSIK